VDLETVEEIKRHVSVVVEGLRADFRFVIDGLGVVTDRLDRVESRLEAVESRLISLESGRFTPRSDA
jgi:hypothetical protein